MANVLVQFSDALAAAAEEGGKSVVRVEGRRRLHGSGIVWGADGVVVTAHHVLERDDGLGVGLPDGRTVPASLVGRDPSTDLAVLRAEADGLAQAQWTAPDELRVGHLALALARPGETVRAALGIVSALGGEWVTGVGGRVDRYLQADITMYPGFSGGPLVDSSGRVMGVNTSGLRRRADVTVPFPTVKRVVNALLEHGEVRRGFLGVSTQPVRLPAAVAERAGQETGLLVTGVSEGAPAEQAGISLGDVIVSLRDRKIRAVDDLLTALGESETGVGVAVRIVRANETKDLEVTIGERPRGG